MTYSNSLFSLEWASLKNLLEAAINSLLPNLFVDFCIVGSKNCGENYCYSIMPPKGLFSQKDFSIDEAGNISFIGTQNPDYEYSFFEDSPYEGSRLLVYIVFDKKKRAKISSLSKKITNFNGNTYHISNSIVDALIEEFKPILHNIFRSDKSSVFPLPTPNELIRNAGKTFLHNIALKGGKIDFKNYAFNLFEDLSFIANTKYEKKIVAGGIVFAKSDHPNIKHIIDFQQSYNISETKRIRKYLELSDASKGQYLLSDSGRIYGLGTIEGYDIKNENLFKVIFENDGKWSLHHGDLRLLNVNRGIPSIPYPQFDENFLTKALTHTFGKVDIANWINCVDSLVRQNKGGVLVISANASKEASRLANDSTQISPIQLNGTNIAKLSSIDGAILANEQGVCYSIGVILDGSATTKGSSTRGARYNSSIRYCEEQLRKGTNVIVIVISDDGMVNIFPSKPQKVNPLLSRLKALKFKLLRL